VAFYGGRLGELIADCVDDGGGLLGREDRRAYRARLCSPIHCPLDEWIIAAPPSTGGAALAAMLSRLADVPGEAWTAVAVAALATAQCAVFEGDQDPGARRSSSTVHISTLDDDGLACAVTASSGYGSGVLVPGAGIYLNNCLGELELNPKGFHALRPAERMASNMAPCVARRADGAVLAVGSPGAERITTALLQVMINFMRLGVSLEEALAAPRLHVERIPGGWRAAVEPGLPLEALPIPYRAFDQLSMFFGGAGAVLRETDGMLIAAADPRRQGAAQVIRAVRA